MTIRRKPLWLLVTIAIAVIAVRLSLHHPDDPLFQGKPLSAWLTQLQHAKTSQESKQVKYAIQQLGSSAVPFLVEQLQRGDPFWKSAYRKLYFGHMNRWPFSIQSRLPRPEFESAYARSQANAAMALGWLGEGAAPAVPALAEALGNDSWIVSQCAGQTLRELGPVARAGLPRMIKLLRAKDAFRAESALPVIAAVARDAPEAGPLLAPLLREQDDVKMRALRILALVGPTAASTEREITPLLSSSNQEVHRATVTALWYVVPSRQVMLLTHVEQWSRSENQELRERSAGYLLAGMDPLTEKGGALLTSIVSNGSDGFCWGAFSVLGQRGVSASNAIPAALTGLKAANPRIAAKAASTLGEIARPSDREVISALRIAQQHGYSMVHDAATEALKKLESKSDATRPYSFP